MAKESFIIYTKYGEQINLLSDTQAGVLLRALIKYQSGEELPKMDGMTNLVFSVIRQQMDFDNNKYDEMCKARSNAGKQGGRPAKPLENKGKETKKANALNDKAKKPNAFLGFDEKAKKAEYEYDNDNEYDIIPPYNPPLESGDGEKDKFFSIYCQFKKWATKDYPNIDFGKLLTEFEQSSQLRKLFSFQVVIDSYDAIIRGDFRDNAKNPLAVDGFEERAKRERWYSARRTKAEADAEKVYKTFLKDETFAKIDKRLRVIDIEQAKAEVKGDKLKAAKLEQEKARLTLQKRGIIERNGITEEDLEPKWNCVKCKDTGFVDGLPCDCYEG
jgi:hypothetical protein